MTETPSRDMLPDHALRAAEILLAIAEEFPGLVDKRYFVDAGALLDMLGNALYQWQTAIEESVQNGGLADADEPTAEPES